MYDKIVEKYGISFKEFDNMKGMPAFRLSLFLSIMRLAPILKLKLSEYKTALVAGSGQSYADTEWENKKGQLQISSEKENLLTFWRELESKLIRADSRRRSREAATYLNPNYFVHQQDPQLYKKVTKALIMYLYGHEYDEEDEDEDNYLAEEWEEMLKEVQHYRDVFIKLFEDNVMLEHTHPLKVWEEHGHELPKLRSCAIKLLSQPLSCMCKQVKKHMKEVEGADDYILRLNFRMMHEFKLLGDHIYKPLDLLDLSFDFHS